MKLKNFRILTPEKNKEITQKRLASIAFMTAEYQLGMYVGQYIVLKYLPTLSISEIQTRNVIQVFDEDEAEYKALDALWTKYVFLPQTEENKKLSEAAWAPMIECYERMIKKYMPQKLVCHLAPLNIVNVDEFKKGISNILWDCDCCSYSTDPENIVITHDEGGFFSQIEFVLNDD
jgi:hypothetical protein